MKKILPALLIGMIGLFVACNPYGKKITINDNTEVFLKGDSATENDARKLGNFVVSTWKESTNKKSFQLSKEKNIYIVKMVVNEEKLKTTPGIELSFMALRMLIEENVFKGSQVKFVLTDNTFKDIRSFNSSYPSDSSMLKRDSVK